MSALIETRALTRIDERRQVALLQPTDFTLKRADRVSITGSIGLWKKRLPACAGFARYAEFRASAVE